MNNNHLHPLTLFELNHIVAEVISIDMGKEYWVEAELSEIHVVRGHCYMELVQKEIFTHTPVAKASAKCWANKWPALEEKFLRVTQQQLTRGMKVLMRVYPQFHEAYGFSWIVTDINAEYTMGEMARRRQEILATLRAEGVVDMQKHLTLSPFATHIAVISSSGAAGYDDFCHQLSHNEGGILFQVDLFPAVMQGNQIESSVIAALDAINDKISDYDVVVVIRGGGSTSDLSGFDTLLLAENVANFPLPIITGIGHQRDESILDIISYKSVKTPTAAAAFLIENVERTYLRIGEMCQNMERAVRRRLDYEAMHIETLGAVMARQTISLMARCQAKVDSIEGRLLYATRSSLSIKNGEWNQMNMMIQHYLRQLLDKRKQRIEILENRLKALDPQLLLKRGYSITLGPDGKIIRNVSALKAGDKLTTQLETGEVQSVVTMTKN